MMTWQHIWPRSHLRTKSMTKTLHYPKTFTPTLNRWKINVEILKKNIQKSQCYSSNLRTKSMIKYTSYKNLRNLFRQLNSCKINYKMQLKNLKHLLRQSLACEVYRKLENKVEDLLPESRRTCKISDKMQQRVVKSIFSQSLLRQINDKMH